MITFIIILIASFSFLYWLIRLKLKFSLPVFVMTATSLLLKILYLQKTPYNVRSYDVGGHIEYVKYILLHHALPRPDLGWQSHHPPLYYLIVSPFYRLAQNLNWDPNLVLQIISLIFSMIFLIFGMLAIREYFGGAKNSIALAFFIFWPSTILHSVRIGNDGLFYALIAIATYYLFSWYQRGGWEDRKYLLVSCLFTALATITKANGIMFALIVAAVGIFKLYQEYSIKRPSRRSIRAIAVTILLSVLIVGSGLGFIFARNYKYADGGRKDWLVFNVSGLGEGLAVGNRVANFAYMDVKMFVMKPFTNPWIDDNSHSAGRQYFWNYYWKTSLFGEWNMPGDTDINYPTKVIIKNMAQLVSVSFLIIFVMFLWYVLTQNKKELIKNNFLWIVTGVYLLMAIYFRASRPYACSNDFRYTLPILLPLAILLQKSIEKVANLDMPVLKYLTYSALFVFVGSSILFIVSI